MHDSPTSLNLNPTPSNVYPTLEPSSPCAKMIVCDVPGVIATSLAESAWIMRNIHTCVNFVLRAVVQQDMLRGRWGSHAASTSKGHVQFDVACKLAKASSFRVNSMVTWTKKGPLKPGQSRPQDHNTNGPCKLPLAISIDVSPFL